MYGRTEPHLRVSKTFPPEDERQQARLSARGARTFDDLWAAYCEFFGIDGPGGAAVLRLAEEVQKDYPEVDLWDSHRGLYPLLEDVLLHSAQRFDASKGSFLKLFERNLRQRMSRDRARAAQAARKRPDAARARTTGPDGDEAGEAFLRWAVRLYRQALVSLDRPTRVYIALRMAGEPVKDIATVLGVSEKTLSNKYGFGVKGDDFSKLAGRVRREVDRLVASLPGQSLALLVRHLLDEADLKPDSVGRLLGVKVEGAGYEGVPLLDEATLLEKLGWAEETDANSGAQPGRSGPPGGVSLTESFGSRLCA